MSEKIEKNSDVIEPTIKVEDESVKAEATVKEEPVEENGEGMVEECAKKLPWWKVWWNRIVSAIVGALIALGASLGITQDHVNEQKARVDNIKELAAEAYAAIKAGDYATAKTALELAATEGKDFTAEAKTVVNNVKQYSAE